MLLLDINVERAIAQEVVTDMCLMAESVFDGPGIGNRRNLFITVGVIEEATTIGQIPTQGGTYLELATGVIDDTTVTEDGRTLDFAFFARGKAMDSAYMGGFPSFVGTSAVGLRPQRPGSPDLVGSHAVPGNPRIVSCSGRWGEHDWGFSLHGHRTWMERVNAYHLSRAVTAEQRAAYRAS